MNPNEHYHISDLRGGAICGLRVDDAPDGSVFLAAMVPSTQRLAGCLECRRRFGLELAYMSVNGGMACRALQLVQLGSPLVVCVAVPAFGHLIARREPVDGVDDVAVLARGEGEGEVSKLLTRDGDRIVVPMLHKADRLDVVIENVQKVPADQ